MKKILLAFFSVCLCALCAFSFAACSNAVYGPTTTDTTKVSANGGLSLVYDNELYFVNGTQTNDGLHNGGTLGSVFKVKLEDDGTIAEGAKYTKVVDALVGQKNGSIFIFGDYLYYTAPSTGKNNVGKVQYGRTKFYRKDLKHGSVQELYATTLADDSQTIQYAYYKYGTDYSKLALVVYEGTSKTLKSFAIDTTVKQNFVKNDVASVVLSENFGVSSSGESAENFVFYTMAAEKSAVDQNTNRVYRINPDGKNCTLINDDANLSLLSIRGEKLLITTTFGSSPEQITYVYAYEITSETQKGAIAVADENNSKNPEGTAYKHIVSTKTYEDIIFVGDASNSIIVLSSTHIMKLHFDLSTGYTVGEDIYTFASKPTVDFVSLYTDGDGHEYLIFMQAESSKNYLYRLRLDETNAEPVKISTTSFETPTSNTSLGLLVAKVVGDYVYAYAKDDKSNVVLYRANIMVAKADADKAELVGGANI